MNFVDKLYQLFTKLKQPDITLKQLFAVFHPQFSELSSFEPQHIIAAIKHGHAQWQLQQHFDKQFILQVNDFVQALIQIVKALDNLRTLDETYAAHHAIEHDHKRAKQQCEVLGQEQASVLREINQVETLLKPLYLKLREQYLLSLTAKDDIPALPAATLYTGQFMFLSNYSQQIESQINTLKSTLDDYDACRQQQQKLALIDDFKLNHQAADIKAIMDLYQLVLAEMDELSSLIGLLTKLNNRLADLFSSGAPKCLSDDIDKLTLVLNQRIEDRSRNLEILTHEIEEHPLAPEHKKQIEAQLCNDKDSSGGTTSARKLYNIEAMQRAIEKEIGQYSGSTAQVFSTITFRRTKYAEALKLLDQKALFLELLKQRERVNDDIARCRQNLVALATHQSIPNAEDKVDSIEPLLEIIKLAANKLPEVDDWRALKEQIATTPTKLSDAQSVFIEVLPPLRHALDTQLAEQQALHKKINELISANKAIHEFKQTHDLTEHKFQQLVKANEEILKEPHEIDEMRQRLRQCQELYTDCQSYFVHYEQHLGLTDKLQQLRKELDAKAKNTRALSIRLQSTAKLALNIDKRKQEIRQVIVTAIVNLKAPQQRRMSIEPKPATVPVKADIVEPDVIKASPPHPSPAVMLNSLSIHYDEICRSRFNSRQTSWLFNAYQVAYSWIKKSDLSDEAQKGVAQQLLNLFYDLRLDTTLYKQNLLDAYLSFSPLPEHASMGSLEPLFRLKPTIPMSDALLSEAVAWDSLEMDGFVIELLKAGLLRLQEQRNAAKTRDKHQYQLLNHIVCLYQYAIIKSNADNIDYIESMNKILLDPKYAVLKDNVSALSKACQSIASLKKDSPRSQFDGPSRFRFFYTSATQLAIEKAQRDFNEATIMIPSVDPYRPQSLQW